MQISDETERQWPDSIKIDGYDIPIVIDPDLDRDTIVIVATHDTPEAVNVYAMAQGVPLSLANLDLMALATEWRKGVQALHNRGLMHGLGPASLRLIANPGPPAIPPEDMARAAMHPLGSKLSLADVEREWHGRAASVNTNNLPTDDERKWARMAASAEPLSMVEAHRDWHGSLARAAAMPNDPLALAQQAIWAEDFPRNVREWILKQPWPADIHPDTRAKQILDVARRMAKNEPPFVNSEGVPVAYSYLDKNGWPRLANGRLVDVPIVPTQALRANWLAKGWQFPTPEGEALKQDMMARHAARQAARASEGIESAEAIKKEWLARAAADPWPNKPPSANPLADEAHRQDMAGEDWDDSDTLAAHRARHQIHPGSLMAQYEDMVRQVDAIKAIIVRDLQDAWHIVKGWFKRK